MSKSKKNRSGLVLLLIFVIFALATASCFMPFADGIVMKGTGLGSLFNGGHYNGFELIFGKKNDSGDQVIEACTMLIVAFAMMAAGAVLAFFGLGCGLAKKKTGIAKALGIFGGLLALAAGIFFLLSKQVLDLDNLSSSLGSVTYNLGVGFLLPGIFGCTAGAGAICIILASL